MYQYDVCIVAFVNIDTDARTLNISKTFAKLQKMIHILLTTTTFLLSNSTKLGNDGSTSIEKPAILSMILPQNYLLQKMFIPYLPQAKELNSINQN